MAQVQAPIQGQGVNGGGNQQQFAVTSLYVGDLDSNITETQLHDIFSQMGHVLSVRVCRDMNTRKSLNYGYVNYSNPQEAARALENLNFTPLNGRPIRIMYSHRDPSIRKSGAGNIFVKNLDKGIDHKLLHDTFSVFGSILSCKVATDSSGLSKGYGFVQFDNEESAHRAIEKLNGMLLNDKQVFVGPFLRRQEREIGVDKTKFNNVYVKNLLDTTNEEDLKKIFGEFGRVTSVVVMRDADGKSKCFGFVNFENSDDAARAVDALNGKKFDDKEWFVGKAQKKSEREIELRHKFEKNMKEAADKFQGANLYIKNLDDSIGDDELKELFSEFGNITSCKVMRDSNGISRGSGFLAFSTPEEANKALHSMNGKMVISKPLYVAIAQRKEERRARLQAQFLQMRPVALATSVGPRMTMYPPGGPGLGQQIFYGQAPTSIMPPQHGFGYQEQLIPGIRPGGAPMPNFFMPMLPQRQLGQRPPGGRRTGGPQQSGLLMQQQMIPRGGAYRYPSGRSMPDLQLAGGVHSVSYDMVGVPVRETTKVQLTPIGVLTSALANASPDQQRNMLGESLYPLIEQLEPESAAKITGMLLEMDQTEVLHLLEAPEELKEKVAEAMDVLRAVQQQQQQQQPQQVSGAAEQLASLPLDDNLVS